MKHKQKNTFLFLFIVLLALVVFAENYTTNTETEFNTGTYTFFIDTIEPHVIHNFLNNSLYYLANITFDLNISDDVSIFSYNVSIGGENDRNNDYINRNRSILFYIRL